MPSDPFYNEIMAQRPDTSEKDLMYHGAYRLGYQRAASEAARIAASRQPSAISDEELLVTQKWEQSEAYRRYPTPEDGGAMLASELAGIAAVRAALLGLDTTEK